MKVEVVQNGEVVQTKEFAEGSYKIGRSPECDIVLKSPSISKQHALLVVKGEKAAIVDLGSANGVFVNGILVRKQRIEPGDEVRIVDFEIRIPIASRFRPPPSRGAGAGAFDGNAARNIDYAAPQSDEDAEAALTPQEKFLALMDQKLLIPFYGVLKTCDWRWVLSCILLGALLSSVILSVIPVVRWGKNITTKEALARAHTIVSQTVRENYRILSKTNDFTRLTVEAAEAEKGVLAAYIVDPKSSGILAPPKNFNKSVTDVYSVLAIKKVLEGKEEFVSVSVEDDVWIVAQPINVYSPDLNENVLSALVLVTFQVTSEVSSTFQPMVEAALFATLFSLAAFFLIFKMVTYPLERMREQLDAALKGDNVNVVAEAKLTELETLATTINFAISRVKQGGTGGGAAITVEDGDAEDAEFMRSVMEFESGSTDGILLLDREKKVRFVGRIIEEMLSLRSQYAQGQNISEACRDAGFSGTAIDMCDRVMGSGGEKQENMLDINGIARNMVAVGHKNLGGDIRFFLLIVKLGEGKG